MLEQGLNTRDIDIEGGIRMNMDIRWWCRINMYSDAEDVNLMKHFQRMIKYSLAKLVEEVNFEYSLY